MNINWPEMLIGAMIAIIPTVVGILLTRKFTKDSILFGLQSTHKQIKNATERLQRYLEGKVRKMKNFPNEIKQKPMSQQEILDLVTSRLATVIQSIEETLDSTCQQLETAHKSLRDYIRLYNKDYDKSEESCQ